MGFSDWGCSSVGRALDLHSRGLGFNSPQLHFLTISRQESNMQSSFLLAILPFSSLRLHFTLHRFSLGNQNAVFVLFLLFFLLLSLWFLLFRTSIFLWFQLEPKHFRDELFSLEVGLEVWVALSERCRTMMRRQGKEVPKKAPSASADFFLGEQISLHRGQ